MGTAVRAAQLLGPALIIAGAVALVVGFLQGEASLSLFLIFPVVTATGGWSALGILLLIAGFLASILTWPTYAVAEAPPSSGPTAGTLPTAPSVTAPRRRWGGVVFLGPVPVVFGSDARIARWMIIVGALLLIGLVVLTVVSLWGI